MPLTLLLGEAMAKKLPFVVLLVSLCIGWYFLVAAVDRGLMIHNSPAISYPCLSSDNLPADSIYTLEGAPVPPGGDYVFVPMGLECTYSMKDGSQLQVFHPRYVQMTVADIPAFALVIWGARKATYSRRGKNATSLS